MSSMYYGLELFQPTDWRLQTLNMQHTLHVHVYKYNTCVSLGQIYQYQ